MPSKNAANHKRHSGVACTTRTDVCRIQFLTGATSSLDEAPRDDRGASVHPMRPACTDEDAAMYLLRLSEGGLPPWHSPASVSASISASVSDESSCSLTQPDLSASQFKQTYSVRGTRCARCKRAKKGCDRMRPCRRCKDSGCGDQCDSADEANSGELFIRKVDRDKRKTTVK
jgi:hypothetical protein